MQIHHHSIDGDNDKSLVTLKTCDKTEAKATKKRVFRGKEKDPPVFENLHEEAFTEKPTENDILYKYFKQFFTDALLRLIVDNTDLYSTQKSDKSMNITIGEMSTFIGIKFMMGLVKLPAFSDHWSNAMHYPAIADNIPYSKFKVLLQIFQFVDNSIFSEGGGNLFKTSPLIEAVRN